jgi:flavin reductase (DIM6/NTAB) family NADH-FMN oxidoreductase RutF
MSAIGALKSVMHPYLRPIEQWAVVALPPRQALITVEFETAHSIKDVTSSHMLAALAPVTIAIAGMSAISDGRLTFRDSHTGALLGWLRLRRVAETADIGLFEVEAGDHACVGWPLRPWNRHLQGRAQRGFNQPGNFAMEPAALQHLMIAYICPRPVTLVSVEAPDHANLFPMDLIGPLGGDRFALALRETSRSVETMRSTRRVVLSDPPAGWRETVYGLGVHHKRPLIDWSALPFATTPTERFGMPAVTGALRIRELAVEQDRAIGSHRFFVGRVVSERVLDDAPQLFHTAGFHAHFRQRHGAPLERA